MPTQQDAIDTVRDPKPNADTYVIDTDTLTGDRAAAERRTGYDQIDHEAALAEANDIDLDEVCPDDAVESDEHLPPGTEEEIVAPATYTESLMPHRSRRARRGTLSGGKSLNSLPKELRNRVIEAHRESVVTPHPDMDALVIKRCSPINGYRERAKMEKGTTVADWVDEDGEYNGLPFGQVREVMDIIAESCFLGCGPSMQKYLGVSKASLSHWYLTNRVPYNHAYRFELLLGRKVCRREWLNSIYLD